MIKINLLPAYILERRQVRRMMQTFMVLAIMLVVAIVAITYGYARSTQKVNEDLATNWAAGRARAQQLNKDTSRLKGDQASRLDVFLKFYDEVLAHNQKIARVLETVNRYIYKAAVVTEMELENDQLRLKCRIDNNENLARFYENLRRCPAVAPDSVKIEKVPVFPIQRSTEEGTPGTTSATPYGPSSPATPYGPSSPATPYSPSTTPGASSETPPTITIPGTSGTMSSISPEFFTRPRILRFPRAEYEFEVTATVTPEYAIPPPPSPLGGAETESGYGYGAYPQGPTGGAAPPGPGTSTGRGTAGTAKD